MIVSDLKIAIDIATSLESLIIDIKYYGQILSSIEWIIYVYKLLSHMIGVLISDKLVNKYLFNKFAWKVGNGWVMSYAIGICDRYVYLEK